MSNHELPTRHRRDARKVRRRAGTGRASRLAGLAGLLMLALGAQPAAAAQYADLVLDAASGRILYATNSDVRVHPASLTKMMTLYMVFQAIEDGHLSMDQSIPISSHAASMPPSKLGLAVGQTIRVEDAVLSLVTKSANDIAVALAEAVAGSESEFGRRATALAQQTLDMPNTVFVNASGLPDSRQITTARDMVNLAIRLRAHFPQYYALFATRSFTYGGVTHANHNKLLGDYAGVDGIKTGYINASGFNLVASAERDGRRIYGVVFGGSTAQGRNARMVELLDFGFAHLPGLPETPPLPPLRQPPGPGVPVLSVAALPAAAEGLPLIRRAQFLAYAGIDRPRSSAASDPQADASGASVPVPILLAALDPTKLPPETAACGDSWAIQVGAFTQADQARSVADDVRLRAASMLADAAVVVDPMQRGSATIYRAMLIGVADQSAAEIACIALSYQGIECVPVAPGTAGQPAACS